MILLIALAFLLFGLSDFPPLVKKKRWYEVITLSVLYAGAFSMAVLMAFHVTLPSPVRGFQTLIVDILQIGYSKT